MIQSDDDGVHGEERLKNAMDKAKDLLNKSLSKESKTLPVLADRETCREDRLLALFHKTQKTAQGEEKDKNKGEPQQTGDKAQAQANEVSSDEDSCDPSLSVNFGEFFGI